MATLSSTTLSKDLAASGNRVFLTSLTSVVVGKALFVDGEALLVTAVTTAHADVLRGQWGSASGAHASGATVYLANPDQLYGSDPVGVAPSNPLVTPWINTTNGRVWVATSGVWVAQTTNQALASPSITGTVTGGATFQSPVITAPSGSGSSGLLITKSGLLTELTGDGTYSVTIPVPAGALIHSIRVTPQALWTAATSAALLVGDTADPDGYFVSTNLKATDLLVGEVFDTISSTLWGGKEGAYLVAASGRRGPTTDNFGPYYAAGSNIVFAATKAGAGTAGRTYCSVTYSIGEAIAQVVT